jgi:mycothiol system anti-sigma-R factor
MKDVLARAYDTLMDREGAAPVLAALANASAVVGFADLRQAVGPIGIGELRDLLMALQPLLLRVDPGTDDELVGFRHPTIAEHVRGRQQHHAEDELWLFVDDELDQASAEVIHEHIDECPACLEIVEDMLAVKANIARAGGDRAPDELKARIRAAVRSQESSQERAAGWERGTAGW